MNITNKYDFQRDALETAVCQLWAILFSSPYACCLLYAKHVCLCDEIIRPSEHHTSPECQICIQGMQVTEAFIIAMSSNKDGNMLIKWYLISTYSSMKSTFILAGLNLLVVSVL